MLLIDVTISLFSYDSVTNADDEQRKLEVETDRDPFDSSENEADRSTGLTQPSDTKRSNHFFHVGGQAY